MDTNENYICKKNIQWISKQINYVITMDKNEMTADAPKPSQRQILSSFPDYNLVLFHFEQTNQQSFVCETKEYSAYYSVMNKSLEFLYRLKSGRVLASTGVMVALGRVKGAVSARTPILSVAALTSALCRVRLT